MRKKTPNAQRRTPNVQFGTWRVAEISDGQYAPKSKSVYDLEDRLLEFAANIVELTDSLPNTRAGNHIVGQLLRCAHHLFPITEKLKRLNPSGTLFTSYEFVLKNCAKQNAGCGSWAEYADSGHLRISPSVSMKPKS